LNHESPVVGHECRHPIQSQTKAEEPDDTMPHIGTRGLWLGTITLAVVLAGLGLRLAWVGRLADPLREAWAAYGRGNWESAASLARARLKTKGDDADALRLAARASVRLGRDDSARTFFHRLGPEAMMPDDLCLLGISLSRIDDKPGALQVWEQARSSDPNHAETLFELTRAYYAAERPIAAAETGRILAGIPGWEARAESLLGTIQLALNDPSGAVALWQRAQEHTTPGQGGRSGSTVTVKDMARALLQAGRPDEARHRLQALLASSPDPEGFWLLSRAHLQEGAMPEALAAWKMAASFRDENPLVPEPGLPVGSAACAPCHRATFHSQQSSRHARTFFRGSELGGLDLPAKTISDPGRADVSQTLQRIEGDRLQLQTQVEGRTFRAIVEYAFGSGGRGLTLVGRESDGHARELRLSHYHSETGSLWDVTTGHVPQPPSLADYLGQALTEDLVRRCFLCHVTDARSALERTGPAASDHGIGCEKCHGPGGNHLLAIAAKFPDRAIARPSLASGTPIVNLCGQCHSPLGRKVSPDEPTAIRFQATTLTWSRCFTDSNDALDCLTCHDPHRNADQSTQTYESKCLLCHSGPDPAGISPSQRRKINLPDRVDRTRCPVNPKSGCIGCHMPTVTDVVPHSAFTDHFIRVHRD
jgi:tetratricopeptide (TPR) repeat protein